MLTGQPIPWLWAACIVLAAAGLYVGFFVAPTDATQGEVYRVIFIHVPAAWMSMLSTVMALGRRHRLEAFNARLASMVARHHWRHRGHVHLPRAADRRLLGEQAHLGHRWVWDARLTSELICCFFLSGLPGPVQRDRRHRVAPTGWRLRGGRCGERPSSISR